MTSAAVTVDEYMAQLPEERKAPMEKLRKTIKKNLPKGFKEEMGYGMMGYVVPHSIYPDGYHCNPKLPLPFMGMASQKNNISVYHMGLYADADLMKWFTDAHAKASPKKLDMGKSCIRYKKAEDIPYDLIGELCTKLTPHQWIDLYEKAFRK
jgi:uncharacterized protein YdhG (YjbR/CyaY superfamily)